MSVDQSMHSLFGVSKTAADLPPRRFHDDYPAWTCGIPFIKRSKRSMTPAASRARRALVALASSRMKRIPRADWW